METIQTFFKCAAVAALLAAASFSVQAQTFDTKAISIRVYDLDLHKPADAQTLLNRLRVGARAACFRPGDSRDFQVVRERATCEQESIVNTLASISAKTGVDVREIAALASSVPDVASK